MNAPPAAAIVAIMTVLNVFRTWDTPPAGVNPRRILIDCQYFRLTAARSGPSITRYQTCHRSAREDRAMRRIAVRVVVASISAAACLVPAPVSAQERASIVGVVQDSSGAVLPGVTVEAASPVLIERVRTGITDGSG